MSSMHHQPVSGSPIAAENTFHWSGRDNDVTASKVEANRPQA
jgi:hypothetical protein